MKMTVVDLLNIYVKTGSAMSARVAGRLVGGFQGFFRIDPEVAYEHFRSKGIAFAKRRRYAQAADVLKQLRTERPEDAEISLYYGISLLKLSKREEGLLVLDDALVGYPDNIRIRALLALAFYQVQAWERALPLLAEAVAQDGADRDAWWRYCTALEQSGDAEGAVGACEAALEHYPEDSALVARLASLLGVDCDPTAEGSDGESDPVAAPVEADDSPAPAPAQASAADATSEPTAEGSDGESDPVAAPVEADDSPAPTPVQASTADATSEPEPEQAAPPVETHMMGPVEGADPDEAVGVETPSTNGDTDPLGTTATTDTHPIPATAGAAAAILQASAPPDADADADALAGERTASRI